MLRLKDNPMLLTRVIRYRIVQGAISYCVDLYGVNPDRGIPKVRVIRSPRKICGEYDYGRNIITINYGKCGDVKLMLKTVIHEYIHYLQPLEKYDIFYILYGYKNHPQEREARYHEMVYSRCWRKIKKTII